uniref:Uncharacterized protein n=1 Tax=Opuntia streptacantha TaxID=393608 RepID=A0A7C9AZM1_OPUST
MMVSPSPLIISAISRKRPRSSQSIFMSNCLGGFKSSTTIGQTIDWDPSSKAQVAPPSKWSFRSISPSLLAILGSTVCFSFSACLVTLCRKSICFIVRSSRASMLHLAPFGTISRSSFTRS